MTAALPPFAVADLAGFLDDAAVFPPGSTPVREAVEAHLARRRGADGMLVGPLVVTPAHLDDVRSALAGTPAAAPSLSLSLVVRDPRTLPPALDAVRSDGRLALAAVELAGPAAEEAGAAPDVTAGLAPEVTVWVEPGWGEHLPDAVRRLRRAGHGLKLRTGGTTSGAFPDEAVLAGAVTAAVTSGVRFKATAGLHHAVRHTDPATGFEHHGFANLLLAAAAGDDGEPAVRTWLACRDAGLVARTLRGLGAAGLATIRRERFVSFGTCDVEDPRRDLVRLGLLPGTPSSGTTGRVA